MGSGKDQHIPRVKSHYRLLSPKVWKQSSAQEVLRLLITGSWNWSMSGEGSPKLCQCLSKHHATGYCQKRDMGPGRFFYLFLICLEMSSLIYNVKDLEILNVRVELSPLPSG